MVIENLDKTSIIAVIPCYNEARVIAGLVSRAKRYVDKVIVADDGSDDRTSIEAREVGAIVAQSISHQGFGKNVMLGLKAALLISGTDIVVTLDGDGQHNPDEIPQLILPITKGEADLVIGSRFLGSYNAPRYRKFGIDIITWLYNIGHKQKITDSQSCFRAYKRELLETVNLKQCDFGLSTEILIKARTQGFRIMEVPISCIYHEDFKMNSSMNPILQGITVALATIKWRLKLRIHSKGGHN